MTGAISVKVGKPGKQNQSVGGRARKSKATRLRPALKANGGLLVLPLPRSDSNRNERPEPNEAYRESTQHPIEKAAPTSGAAFGLFGP
ncbi:hypothetical protein GCM10022406_34110 [Hymenobacter algoricola]|uniref:Uncharacterized protein n=1 Tax=Hymenobacter algoricola TaxID=486267 RepID=A0ABP7NKX1_9BACT